MEYIKLSYHHLNFEDRTALMLESRKEGFSARKFAELIKRHPSTIYRELKRNSINDVYQARYASDNTFARRRRGHRKLKIDSILWKFIVEAIRCLWSPQQIAKRLKTFPDLDQTMNVSHTTIYSTIRALPKGELKKDLLSCLRHENKKRKANGEPKKDSILQDIKTIHERPAEVQERKIPGHWEADLIKGQIKELLQQIQLLTYEDSLPIFNQLYEIQDHLATAKFRYGLDLNEALDIFVYHFDRDDKALISQYWYQKFKQNKDILWPLPQDE